MYKLLEWITEAIGWVRIVASPLLLGLIIGAVIYFPDPTTIKLVLAICIAGLGLVIGIIWATRVWKRKGTMEFLSRTMATPELDKQDGKKDE